MINLNKNIIKKLKNNGIFILIVLFGVFITYKIQASSNWFGFGWGADAPSGNLADSSGAGWISFNCDDDQGTNTCSTSDYKVTYDPGTGYISGFAWSSNYGWLQFGSLTGCPNGICQSLIDNAGNMHGWAKFISADQGGSGGWDGWVSLNCDNTNTCATSQYGVFAGTPISGKRQLSGFGWGNSKTGTDFGISQWIKFDGYIKEDATPVDALVKIQANPTVLSATPPHAFTVMSIQSKNIKPNTCKAISKITPQGIDLTGIVDANSNNIFDENDTITDPDLVITKKWYANSVNTNSGALLQTSTKQVDPYGLVTGTETTYEIVDCQDNNGTVLNYNNCPMCVFKQLVVIGESTNNLALVGTDTMEGDYTTLTWYSPNMTEYSKCESSGAKINKPGNPLPFEDVSNWQVGVQILPPPLNQLPPNSTNPVPYNNYGLDFNQFRNFVGTTLVSGGAVSGDKLDFKITCFRANSNISDEAIATINIMETMQLNLSASPSLVTYDFDNPAPTNLSLTYDSKSTLGGGTLYDSCSSLETSYSLTDPSGQSGPSWSAFSGSPLGWVKNTSKPVPVSPTFSKTSGSVEAKKPSALPPFTASYWLKFTVGCDKLVSGNLTKKTAVTIVRVDNTKINSEYVKLEVSNDKINKGDKVYFTWNSNEPIGGGQYNHYEYDSCQAENANETVAVYVYPKGNYNAGSAKVVPNWTVNSLPGNALWNGSLKLANPVPYFNYTQPASVANITVPGNLGDIARFYIHCTNSTSGKSASTFAEVEIVTDNAPKENLSFSVSPSQIPFNQISQPIMLSWGSTSASNFNSSSCSATIPANLPIYNGYYPSTSIGNTNSGIPSGISLSVPDPWKFGAFGLSNSPQTTILPSINYSVGDVIDYYIACTSIVSGDTIVIKSSLSIIDDQTPPPSIFKKLRRFIEF